MLFIKPELIHELPSFTPSSTIAEADAFLNQMGYSILPLTDQNQYYLGNILGEDLIAQENMPLEDILYLSERIALQNNKEYCVPEVLSFLHKHDINIAPIVSSDNKLLGIIKKEELQEYWNTTTFNESTGVYIILSKKEHEINFSEMAQIVESNNAKIFGLLQIDKKDNEIYLLLKTNGTNTSKILDDFRRFDYTIVNHLENDDYYADLKEKADYLNKYLNI